MFYTALQNLYFGIILEGYERAVIRKEIDKDDPFPTVENILRKRMEEIEKHEHELCASILEKSEQEDPLTIEINALLRDPDIDQSAKNAIICLQFEYREVNSRVFINNS